MPIALDDSRFPLAAPTLVTATLEEADAWARERFREKGGLGA
jgi:hypothetical protein